MFKSALQLEKTGKTRWKVLHELLWEEDFGSQYGIELLNQHVVPVGFITDLASIPGWLQGLPYLQVNSRSTSPAVLHDYLYVTQNIDRKGADLTLKRALIAEGEHKLVATLYYYAVRIGGRFAWNKHKKELQKNKL